MKKKLCALVWVAVLCVLIFLPVSCKKEAPLASAINDTASLIPAGELPGLKTLLSLNELNDTLKTGLNLNQYQYYERANMGSTG